MIQPQGSGRSLRLIFFILFPWIPAKEKTMV